MWCCPVADTPVSDSRCSLDFVLPGSGHAWLKAHSLLCCPVADTHKRNQLFSISIRILTGVALTAGGGLHGHFANFSHQVDGSSLGLRFFLRWSV